MSQGNIKQLKVQLDKFKNRVENFKPTDDVGNNDQEIREIEEIETSIDQLLDQIKEDFEDDEELSSQRQLLDKVQEQKNDFEIYKNKFNGKKDKARSAASQELLKQGKLTGVEKKKAERDMAIDLNKEVDEQGLMLDSIHKNVLGANENLENMNTEAKRQGEQLDRVGERVVTIDSKVKKTGHVMTEMERRICCRKCILWMGIIILTITNIVMIFMILAKHFKWYPFADDKPKDDGKKIDPTDGDSTHESDSDGSHQMTYIKGIDYENYENSINYGDIKGKDLEFVFLPIGKGEDKEDKFDANYNSAKDNSIEVGIYWTITENVEETVLKQAEKASDCIGSMEDKKFNKNFYFKFTQDELRKNSDLINKACEKLTSYDKCGIMLKKTEYDEYFKNKNVEHIKLYMIEVDNENQMDDYKDDNKVLLFRTSEEETIGTTKFKIIKEKKATTEDYF